MSQTISQQEQAPINRKLARLTTIREIRRHPNADTLEIAVVDGWQVVVKEGQYVAGDLTVFVEIDSIVPDVPAFEFLRDKSFRVKTIKLRGEISQGVCIPPRVLADEPNLPYFVWDPRTGNYQSYDPSTQPTGPDGETDEDWNGYIVTPQGDNDLTTTIGVTKYCPPLAEGLVGKALGQFPSFIPKTDQERIQNIPDKVAESFAAGDEYEATIKLDGTSCTVFCYEGRVGVCSRNLELDPADAGNTMWRVATESGLLKALKRVAMNMAIQCELMGPGVQGNREKLDKATLFVYDMYDINNGRYLNPKERRLVFENFLDLKVDFNHAPILQYGQLPGGTVDELLKFADGKSYKHDVREGVVFKRMDGKFSFKVINNRFLLKHEQ